MASALRRLAWFLAFSILTTFPAPTYAWDSDLELFDLVEEINQNFYEFLSVLPDASGADIRKAYRRLSLTLHPDKNKDENAETQFRQLVAIYEVLKDEERRQRYNDILVNGLPDWRQPVFYYRRVRRMSNGELGFLLFLILTVGHYAVIWSIYLEKQLDELLSKKKKEKKKKMSTKTAEELKCSGQDRVERDHEKPHWQDILPLKLSIWLYMSIKSLPHVIQDVKQYYEDYKEMKMKEKEEAQAMAEQEATQKEKRPKVKKAKFEFPAYTPSLTDTDSGQFLPSYDQGTSIQEVEDQMDDWLDDCKPQKKKAPEWTEEDLSLLTRSMAKFPGGTPGRWEKIAHELGRSVTEVTAKAKQLKDCVTNSSGLVKLSELKGSSSAVKASRAAAGSVPDSLMTQRESPPPPNPEPSAGGAEPGGADPSDGAQALRRRSRKTGGEVGGEAKVKGRRQRDFDPTAAEEDSEEEHSPSPSARQGTKEKSGDQGAKEKSGDQGTKEKSGDQGAKEKSGDQGAKEKSGDQGAKEKSGDQASKEKSGDQGAKEKSGDQASKEKSGDQGAKEKSGAADEMWTQNQQKLLELALQQYPRGTTERWDRIAKGVPGKSKEECMIRYKLLAELVQKRKQAKS